MESIPYDKRSGKIWFNGKTVDWKDANIHILNHGLHYASCVFEGLRIYNGKIFKLDEHIERLFNSAKILDLDIPFEYYEVVDITKEIIVKHTHQHYTIHHQFAGVSSSTKLTCLQNE